jgi:hypothetical protein
VLAAQVRHRHAGFLLSQDRDDLLFREPRSLHPSVPFLGRTLAIRGGVSGGHVTADDRYLLTSERDCVEFDPVQVKARYCVSRPPCAGQTVQNATYLGRFDWMNGFDPPKGGFSLGFRFLGFEDAAESGSCSRQSADGR